MEGKGPSKPSRGRTAGLRSCQPGGESGSSLHRLQRAFICTMALNVTSKYQAGVAGSKSAFSSQPALACFCVAFSSVFTSDLLGIINISSTGGALSSWKRHTALPHTGLLHQIAKSGEMQSLQDTSPEHLFFPHQSPEPRVALTSFHSMPPQHCHLWPQNQACSLMPFQSSPILGL